MKTTTPILLMILMSFSLSAQDMVPESVLAAFQKKVPHAAGVFWEFRENAFVGLYTDLDALKKAFFSSGGEWLETRTRIDMTDLPEGVSRFLKRHYQDADVTYLGRVESPGKQFYRVESELPTSVVIKLLDEQGNLLEERKIDWSYSFSSPGHGANPDR